VTRHPIWLMLAVLALAVPSVAGQGPVDAPTAQPPASAQPPAPSDQPPPPDAAPPMPEAYTYQPEGRRDPFVSLLRGGAEMPLPSERGEGAAGIAVAEVSVRGTVRSHGEFIAMIQGPNSRTFLVHQGDRLADGTIKSITAEGLVIVQEVNDPLSLVPTREVRKLLRSYDQAKE
jgi:Tfp pilus assembly protein PilP